MSPWTQVWLLAKREFVERGRTKLFIVAMVIIVIAIVAIGPIANVVMEDEPEPTTVGLLGTEPPGIEDELIAQGELFGIEIVVVRYPPGAAYEVDLEEGLTAAVLIDGAEVKFYDHPDDSLAALIHRSVDVTVKGSALEHLGLSEGEIAAFQAPVPITVSTVEATDDLRDDPQKQAALFSAFIGALALFIAIVMFAQFVAMGTVEEKQNQVVEVVLSKVRSWQLLVGKVVGIGLLGLVQLSAFVGAALVSVQFVDIPGLDLAAIGLPIIASVFFWFILGYTFYAFLYAAIGSTISRAEDLQGVLWLPTVLIMPGYFLSIMALEDPDRIAAKIASMTPMWAPFVMPVRIGGGVAAPWEIAVAVVGTVLGAVALVWIGSRVYRGSLLRTGSKVKLRDAWRGAAE